MRNDVKFKTFLDEYDATTATSTSMWTSMWPAGRVEAESCFDFHYKACKDEVDIILILILILL